LGVPCNFESLPKQKIRRKRKAAALEITWENRSKMEEQDLAYPDGFHNVHAKYRGDFFGKNMEKSLGEDVLNPDAQRRHFRETGLWKRWLKWRRLLPRSSGLSKMGSEHPAQRELIHRYGRYVQPHLFIMMDSEQLIQNWIR
ncbi:hypothetical protein JD844_013755, partial [Phrynosoma platyrhinos]